jgi:uncharacterized protein (TIGR02453 family)
MSGPRTAPNPLSRETFAFLRELAKNNRKAWMDANRERYQDHVVAALRGLVAGLAPALGRLDSAFETSGRFGTNLSRINRDTRFAKDKAPYRTRIYVTFARRGVADGTQFFIGLGTDVSLGFRCYGGAKDSVLRTLGPIRAADNPDFLAEADRHLRRRYDCYWYKGSAWTKVAGFPARPEDWRSVKGIVVRRKLSVLEALRPGFVKGAASTFEDLYPLHRFTALA